MTDKITRIRIDKLENFRVYSYSDVLPKYVTFDETANFIDVSFVATIDGKEVRGYAPSLVIQEVYGPCRGCDGGNIPGFSCPVCKGSGRERR